MSNNNTNRYEKQNDYYKRIEFILLYLKMGVSRSSSNHERDLINLFIAELQICTLFRCNSRYFLKFVICNITYVKGKSFKNCIPPSAQPNQPTSQSALIRNKCDF